MTYLYPQLGITIGVPVLILAALVCAAGVLWLIAECEPLAATVLGVAMVGILALAAFATWPLQPKYWGNYAVNGTVTSISRQIASDGDGSFTQYVVRLTGQRGVILVDDSRMSAVHTGERVSLFCQLEWQAAAATVVECSALRSYR